MRANYSIISVVTGISLLSGCSSARSISGETDEYQLRRDALVDLIKHLYEQNPNTTNSRFVYSAIHGDSPPRMFLGPFISDGKCGDSEPQESPCRYSISISDRALSNDNNATLTELIVPADGDISINLYYLSWSKKWDWTVRYTNNLDYDIQDEDEKRKILH